MVLDHIFDRFDRTFEELKLKKWTITALIAATGFDRTFEELKPETDACKHVIVPHVLIVPLRN